MTDVRKERGLGPIQLRQSLRTLAFLLDGAGAVDGGGDVARDQVEECPVFLVHATRGITPADQNRGGLILAAGHDRHQHALRRSARAAGPSGK